MYANAYIICVRYVVASVDPPLSCYRSTCTPRTPPALFHPNDGRWPPTVRARVYLLIYADLPHMHCGKPLPTYHFHSSIVLFLFCRFFFFFYTHSLSLFLSELLDSFKIQFHWHDSESRTKCSITRSATFPFFVFFFFFFMEMYWDFKSIAFMTWF